jgi:hypothetical protein
MATKEDIRPIYAELQGYYSEIASVKSDYIDEPSVWEHYNDTVDLLGRLSDRDYSRFRVKVEPESVSQEAFGVDLILPERVSTLGYRTSLAGLLKSLHATYFSNDPDPIAAGPATIITQTQTQNQSVYIQMIMEINEQLTRSEAKFKEGTPERGFIDKVKACLRAGIGGITSMAQLMLLLLSVAKECGLSVEDMRRIFGG